MGLWEWLLGKKSRVPAEGASGHSDAVRVISVLPPELVSEDGLPHHAVVGTVRRDDASGLDSFIPNPAFIELMHLVIRDSTADAREAQAEARRIGRGWLYITDQRRPPDGSPVPPHDIIGYFRVEDGRLLPESYARNSGHVLLTEHGLVRLPGALHEELVARASRKAP